MNLHFFEHEFRSEARGGRSFNGEVQELLGINALGSEDQGRGYSGPVLVGEYS
jgi:hypothetical protein